MRVVRGYASNGFESGKTAASGDGCKVNLTPRPRTRRTRSATETWARAPAGYSCGGTNILLLRVRQLIFSNNIFFHADDAATGPVFLRWWTTSLVQRQEDGYEQRKQGHGLVRGAQDATGPVEISPRQDTNGNGTLGPVTSTSGWRRSAREKNDSAEVRAVHREPEGRRRRRKHSSGDRLPGWRPAPPNLISDLTTRGNARARSLSGPGAVDIPTL